MGHLTFAFLLFLTGPVDSPAPECAPIDVVQAAAAGEAVQAVGEAGPAHRRFDPKQGAKPATWPDYAICANACDSEANSCYNACESLPPGQRAQCNYDCLMANDACHCQCWPGSGYCH